MIRKLVPILLLCIFTFTITSCEERRRILRDLATQDEFDWESYIEEPLMSSRNEILSFGVEGQLSETVIDRITDSILVVMPNGTDLSSLVPSITIDGVSVDPESNKEQDFRNPINYTVTAEDGGTRQYFVSVSEALSDSREILSFSISGQVSETVIEGNEIYITMPYAASLHSLTPSIAINGVSINPASGVARDFRSPVTYTVTAADGSVRSYNVNVDMLLSDEKEILSFSISGQVSETVIEGNDIYITMPYGRSLQSLVPSISINGVGISPASGVARDFRNPVTYTVTAADGSVRSYNVHVDNVLSDEKEIVSFSISGQASETVIEGNEIYITMPYATSLHSLVPSISINGVGISPASGVARDFRNPVTYTVTAADGSVRSYNVNVDTLLSDEKEILSFSISGQISSRIIEGDKIYVTMPHGTSLNSLAPSINIIGATVYPESGIAVNFTEPVIYVVRSQDGEGREYLVTVSLAAPDPEPEPDPVIGGVCEEPYEDCQIGDIGPAGGHIFITPNTPGNNTGLHFEAAPHDAPSGMPWQCPADGPYDGLGVQLTPTHIGAGKTNTKAIVDFLKERGETGNRAAYYCDDYSHNAFTDWFLPSIDEIDQIHINEEKITDLNMFGNYWTSSESNGALHNAWFINFGGGYKSPIGDHKFVSSKCVMMFNVRCVRSF